MICSVIIRLKRNWTKAGSLPATHVDKANAARNCSGESGIFKAVLSFLKISLTEIFLRTSIMPRATWNGAVLAESNRCQVVEGNQYFPAEDVKMEYFQTSDTHTTCPWKGIASYYSVVVEGQTNKDAAWYYPSAKDAAKNIEGHIAFWKGVKVEV
jgi:uncharacterized protein (DUF427 family)